MCDVENGARLQLSDSAQLRRDAAEEVVIIHIECCEGLEVAEFGRENEVDLVLLDLSAANQSHLNTTMTSGRQTWRLRTLRSRVG
jgi:hypothetical protein